MTPDTAVGRADRLRLALGAIAVLLAAADTYVVVVALPNIMNGVGLGLDHLQRATPIISGFLLGYTAVLPLIGRLADLAGTGPVFAGCLALFGTGSVVTATAHSLPVLILGRGVQGVGGGGLVPVTLAMVAQRWRPDDRGRPLGIVGALQELGSVIGPLYGAAIVSVSSWRTIFWINLPVVILLGVGLWWVGSSAPRQGQRAMTGPDGRRDLVGPVLAVIGAVGLGLGLDAPPSLANSTSIGQLYTPRAGGAWAPLTTPVVLISLGVLVAFGFWELLAPAGVRPVVPLRRLPGLVRSSDLPGAALLAGVLACVVVAFSTADPSHQVVASSAPVVIPLAALLTGGFWWRQRHARQPLIEPGALAGRPAWGALLVNLALGGGLMAALVDVPLFARSTVYPNSEVSAALVLLRFLVAVPVGAILGGFLCRNRRAAPYLTAAGMAVSTLAFIGMATWSATALGGGPRVSDVELVLCGFGVGLAIAPVNVAVLGAVADRYHALASALAVVARTIGMLAGLSALTAVALRRFYAAQARIGSPITLCPKTPNSCPAYDNATTKALLGELHTIFGGAAVCTAVAGILALMLLRAPGPKTPSETVEDTWPPRFTAV